MADTARDLIAAVRRLTERGERDRDALARVLSLHRPDVLISGDDGEHTCVHDGMLWPCPTVRAIDAPRRSTDE